MRLLTVLDTLHYAYARPLCVLFFGNTIL